MPWISQVLQPPLAFLTVQSLSHLLIFFFHLSSSQWFSSRPWAFLARFIKEVSTHLFPSSSLQWLKEVKVQFCQHLVWFGSLLLPEGEILPFPLIPAPSYPLPKRSGSQGQGGRKDLLWLKITLQGGSLFRELLWLTWPWQQQEQAPRPGTHFILWYQPRVQLKSMVKP